MDDASVGSVVGMGLILVLALLALSGLITGALARWLLPGPDPMSWLATIGYGIGGSLVGGLAARVVGLPPGFNFVVGIAGAAFLIWFFRRRNAGS